MSRDIAIKVNNIDKSFQTSEHQARSLKQFVIHAGRHAKPPRQQVLKNIDLEVYKGEFFGIVGRNGSGKSTLLKLLAGVYSPDKGNVEIHGNLVPFIELGVGFNPELTGKDNVFLNGALLGFTRKEMKAMYTDIVSFAELEEHMDKKLKNYSSGMQVRLAFSIAIRAKSDILLIDEVLAVGDTNFQKKCMEVFENLKQEGRTIVFITHSMEYVREFCDRVAVLDSGIIRFIGDTEKAVDIYNKLNFDIQDVQAAIENKKKDGEVERFGNGKARITSYTFYDKDGKETIRLNSGEEFSVELAVDINDTVENPALGIMFRKEPHENLFGINSFYNKVNFGVQKKGDTLKIKASGVMPLAPGTYHVSFSISDARSAGNYSELDNLNNVLKVNVDGDITWGLIASKMKMEIQK